MFDRALVIAAHPDDEVLGCGGTLRLLADRGAACRVVWLADGVSSRGEAAGAPDRAELDEREAAARKACAAMGVASMAFGGFADNRMDGTVLLDVVKVVENEIATFQPDVVFTHHAGDVNVDHRAIHRAVVTACRPQRGHPVRTLLFFEVASSTEWQPPGSDVPFLPNWFVDISKTLPRKIEAMAAYEAELRDWPHPRSLEGIEHLARWRGATIGAEAAEAFILGRHLA